MNRLTYRNGDPIALPAIGCTECDHARAAGMTYGDLVTIATKNGIDAAEWESLLCEVDESGEDAEGDS